MHKTVIIMSAVVAIIFPSAALAGPVSIGQWYEFDFSGLGAALTGCSGSTCGLGTNPVPVFLSDAPWTFTTATTTQLTVTDGFASGDRFQLFDNLASIGQTSAASTGVNCGSDITACLANSSMSKGAFSLAAGAHSITGVVTASVGFAGVGFLEITSPVPEPMTLSIFCAGLVGTAPIRRRKAKSRSGTPYGGVALRLRDHDGGRRTTLSLTTADARAAYGRLAFERPRFAGVPVKILSRLVC